MTARNSFLAASLALALVPFGTAPAAGGTTKADTGNQESATATAPLLRERVTVDDKYVYLGDLFINAGPKSESAVAYAPRPGERAVLDARWLYRVARAYGLNWKPMSVRQEVIVNRASQVVERSEIEDAVLAALYEKGADPNSELDFTTPLTRVNVSTKIQVSVGVDDVSYDARTHRFSTIVSIPANSPTGEKLRLTGRLYPVVKIPVPAHVINRGEIINRRDIKFIRIRAERLLPDSITKEDDLVGMASRRGMRPDELVRQADIERPVLVQRGSMVTVTLVHGTMALTAQGKALESGAQGDTVRIMNERSKNVFEGEITGPGRATIRVLTAREIATR